MVLKTPKKLALPAFRLCFKKLVAESYEEGNRFSFLAFFLFCFDFFKLCFEFFLL